MSDDDDTGGGKKKLAQLEAVGKKPVTLKLWVVAVIALLAFLVGSLLF